MDVEICQLSITAFWPHKKTDQIQNSPSPQHPNLWSKDPICRTTWRLSKIGQSRYKIYPTSCRNALVLWTSGWHHHPPGAQLNSNRTGSTYGANNGKSETAVRLLRITGRGNHHFNASKMVLAIHRRGICKWKKARSHAGGPFFPSNNNPSPPNNGAILTNATIIKNVMSSAAEAEIGALYLNAREAVYLRQILIEMGPATTYPDSDRQYYRGGGDK